MDLHSELIFRVVFGAFWVVGIFVRIHFQRLALGAERAFIRHQRRERMHFYAYLVTYLLFALYFLSGLVDFASVPMAGWIRWLGVGFLIGYLDLFASAHRALGTNWSGTLEIHKEHQLIITGPYRFVRHPMYSAFYLSAVGFSLLSANWLVSLLYVASLSWMVLGRVRDEEEMMIDQFGGSYREYMKTTGRLLPKSFRDPAL